MTSLLGEVLKLGVPENWIIFLPTEMYNICPEEVWNSFSEKFLSTLLKGIGRNLRDRVNQHKYVLYFFCRLNAIFILLLDSLIEFKLHSIPSRVRCPYTLNKKVTLGLRDKQCLYDQKITFFIY